jgi:hypothetical protein
MKPLGTSVFALFVLFLCAAPLLAQKKEEKDTAKKAEKAYLFVDLDQLRRYPENYKDKDIRISDRFGQLSNIYPRSLQRKGIMPAKYLEFATSSAIGSNMTCYVDKSSKEAVALVSNLTKDAPITLEGTVYGVVNTMLIFMADRVYSGYEIPPQEPGKPQITMIMQWETDPTGKKYKYVISKPGQFVLTDPTTNKKISVEFQY